MKVEEIRVGERHRKDMGDLASLAASIDSVGLLNPVIVDYEGNLICGARRLMAVAEYLGRDDIEVKRVNLENPLQAEHDENVERKDFLPTEKVAIVAAILEQETAAAKERMRSGGGKLPHPAPAGTTGKARDKAAAAVGWSGHTLERAARVVSAAVEDPDLQPLVEEMDRTGKVAGAYRRLPSVNNDGSAADTARLGSERPLIGMTKRTGLTAAARLRKVADALSGYAEALPNMHLRGEDVDDVLAEIQKHAGAIRLAAKALRGE